MSERDELALELFIADNGKQPREQSIVDWGWFHSGRLRGRVEHYEVMADTLITAGYRKIFDGDCGLGGIDNPADRDAAEAWMRWANLVNWDGGEPNSIGAMKQMLHEFGYRKADRLQAAIDAVLALHQPEKRWMPYRDADRSYDTAEEAALDLDHTFTTDPSNIPFFEVCSHCKTIEESPCDGECTQEAGYRESLWPCPTVAAINNAREGWA